MSDAQAFRQKRDQALDDAARAANMSERSRLVTEASHWHQRALAAEFEATRTETADA